MPSIYSGLNRWLASQYTQDNKAHKHVPSIP